MHHTEGFQTIIQTTRGSLTHAEISTNGSFCFSLPRQGIEPKTLSFAVQRLSHWTTAVDVPVRICWFRFNGLKLQAVSKVALFVLQYTPALGVASCLSATPLSWHFENLLKIFQIFVLLGFAWLSWHPSLFYTPSDLSNVELCWIILEDFVKRRLSY